MRGSLKISGLFLLSVFLLTQVPSFLYHFHSSAKVTYEGTAAFQEQEEECSFCDFTFTTEFSPSVASQISVVNTPLALLEQRVASAADPADLLYSFLRGPPAVLL